MGVTMGRPVALLVAMIVAATPAAGAGFREVAGAAGLVYSYPPPFVSDPPQFCGGVAAADVDRDGDIDLYATTPAGYANHLYRNEGDRTFTDVAVTAGVEAPTLEAGSATFADLDGDRWPDLIVPVIGGGTPATFRNRGDGTFEDTSATNGLTTTRDSTSAAFGDVDGDGDLDLFLAHWGEPLTLGASSESLWENDGRGVFTDVSVSAGVTAALLGGAASATDHGFTPNFVDLDGDHAPEILLASDFGTSRVLRNDGTGGFTDVTQPAVITDENGMGAAIGDFDGDLRLDWFVSSIWDPNGISEGQWGVSGNRLYRGLGGGTFEDVTAQAGVREGYWGWGSTFGDFDADGQLDLFHTNGFGTGMFPRTAEFDRDPSRLFLSNGDGTFREESLAAGIVDEGLGRGVVAFDWDRDGDLDLLVTNSGGHPRLFDNTGTDPFRSLTVRLEGRPPNTAAIGAEVRVTAGDMTRLDVIRAGSNFVSQNPAEAHFGVGRWAVADVHVTWPDGRTSQRAAVPTGGVVVLTEPSTAVTFADVTSSAGVAHRERAAPATGLTPPYFQEEFTGGAAAGDFDGDGYPDLFVSRSDGPPALFRNQGDGTFVDVAGAAGIAAALPSGSNAAAWGDLDNDGDRDLYVTSWNGTRYHLFINHGDGTFSEEALGRGAALATANPHFGQGVTVGDYDRDGFLDLYVAELRTNDARQNPAGLPSHNRLLRNRGAEAPGVFDDVTVAAGADFDAAVAAFLGVDDFQLAFAPRFADLDGDGWPDLAITADSGQSTLFWNDGDGTFTEGRTAAGIGETGFSDMGSAIEDFDGDGRLDWFITDIFQREPATGRFLAQRDGNRLYLNDGDRTFTEAGDGRGMRGGYWGWGASGFDFDNDGDMDIVHTNGIQESFEAPVLVAQFQHDPMVLFENDGTGTFTDVAAARGMTDRGQGKGLLTFDYDRDGDLDVFVVNHGGDAVLYRNDGGNGQHWLQLDLVGRLSNRDAIGAVVRVTPDLGQPGQVRVGHVDGGSNFLGQDEPTLHVGLGASGDRVDRVEIHWPSGIVQVLSDLPTDARHTVIEPVELPAGGKLRVRRARAGTYRLAMLARDTTLTLGAGPGSVDDPVVGGGRLRIGGLEGVEADYELEPAGWRVLRRRGRLVGYEYRSKTAIRSVLVKAGRRISVRGRLATGGGRLDRPERIDVELRLGDRRYCMRFGTIARFNKRGLVARTRAGDQGCPFLPGDAGAGPPA